MTFQNLGVESNVARRKITPAEFVFSAAIVVVIEALLGSWGVGIMDNFIDMSDLSPTEIGAIGGASVPVLGGIAYVLLRGLFFLLSRSSGVRTRHPRSA